MFFFFWRGYCYAMRKGIGRPRRRKQNGKMKKKISRNENERKRWKEGRKISFSQHFSIGFFFVNRRYSFNATNIFFPSVRWFLIGCCRRFSCDDSKSTMARSLSPSLSLLTVSDVPDNDAKIVKLHISYLFMFPEIQVPPRYYRWIEQRTGIRSKFTSTTKNSRDLIYDGKEIASKNCRQIISTLLRSAAEYDKKTRVKGTNHLLIMPYQTYPTPPKSWWPGDARLPVFIRSIISLAPHTAIAHYVFSRIVKLKNPFARWCIRTARLKLYRVRKLSVVMGWEF